MGHQCLSGLLQLHVVGHICPIQSLQVKFHLKMGVSNEYWMALSPKLLRSLLSKELLNPKNNVQFWKQLYSQEIALFTSCINTIYNTEKECSVFDNMSNQDNRAIFFLVHDEACWKAHILMSIWVVNLPSTLAWCMWSKLRKYIVYELHNAYSWVHENMRTLLNVEQDFLVFSTFSSLATIC